MKKVSITIGIPALNEEGTILFLLQDLQIQEIADGEVEKIIIISDGSTDKTVEKVKSLKDKRIVVHGYKKRVGKSKRLNQIIEKSVSDILVLLDADTEVRDQEFIQKLIKPIVEKRAELTSSSIVELAPRSFVEEVLDVSMALKRVLFENFKKGNNLYNCHGPARAVSKKLYKKLKFEEALAGDDMYSYLRCIQLGGRFVFVKKVKIHYRLPSTFNGHLKQSVRYLSSIESYSKLFSERLVRQELTIPKKVFIISGFKALPIILRYPIHIVAYMGILSFVWFKSKTKINLAETWDVRSSKILKNNNV